MARSEERFAQQTAELLRRQERHEGEPIDLTWLFWGRRIGVALLALGAGTSGAVLVALLMQPRGATPQQLDPAPIA